MTRPETPADEPSLVIIERINELVDAIIPRPGCALENGEAAALALVELVHSVAGEGYSFGEEVDSAASAAYWAARRAFERSQSFEAALEDWKYNDFAAALKKGGE